MTTDHQSFDTSLQLYCFVKWWDYPRCIFHKIRIKGLSKSLESDFDGVGFFGCVENRDVYRIDFTLYPDDMLSVYIANDDILYLMDYSAAFVDRTWQRISSNDVALDTI